MSELAFIDSAGVAIIHQNMVAKINEHGSNTTTHADIREKIEALERGELPSSSIISVANGGTGAANKSAAKQNLGIASGSVLPSTGEVGDLFFLY